MMRDPSVKGTICWISDRSNQKMNGPLDTCQLTIELEIDRVAKEMADRIEGGRRTQGKQPKTPPLVSVVTVIFRAKADLPELLASVFRLKDEKTELIVIDGGSNDGTRELLSEFDSEIDYWVSEPDMGIYDAMNKGVAAAQGTFIYHLNAGDRLLSIPTAELEAAVSNQVDVAAFRVSVDGRDEFRPARGFSLRVKNTLHHQGTFFRREGLPLYDIRYRVFADFDLNQRLAIRGARIELFDQVVATHMSGGVSDIPSGATISEFFAVIAKNYGVLYLPIAWILCKWRGLLSKLKRYAGVASSS